MTPETMATGEASIPIRHRVAKFHFRDRYQRMRVSLRLSLTGKVHPSQQVLEARVIPHAIQNWTGVSDANRSIMLFIGPLKPEKGLVLLTHSELHKCTIKRGNVVCL